MSAQVERAVASGTASDAPSSPGTPLYSVTRVPMTFPVTNRPIHVTPVADMTHKNKETAWPAMATAVRGLLLHHPDERVLIHAVSYDLARHLNHHSLLGPPHGRVFTYTSARERDSAIDAYLDHPAGVLIAPSLERGVDFKHDACRVIAVCKVPYPNLGDRQVSARIHSPGGDLWYRVQTVRSLVQMTGRGVRSADDYCATYLLDQQFLSVWKRSRQLLPKWWADALDFEGRHVRQFIRAS